MIREFLCNLFYSMAKRLDPFEPNELAYKMRQIKRGERPDPLFATPRELRNYVREFHWKRITGMPIRSMPKLVSFPITSDCFGRAITPGETVKVVRMGNENA